MKLHEFLDEIQMLPEATEKIRAFAASGRVAEDVYLENRLLYYKERDAFYKKNTFGEGLPAAVSVLFLSYGGRNL